MYGHIRAMRKGFISHRDTFYSGIYEQTLSGWIIYFLVDM